MRGSSMNTHVEYVHSGRGHSRRSGSARSQTNPRPSCEPASLPSSSSNSLEGLGGAARGCSAEPPPLRPRGRHDVGAWGWAPCVALIQHAAPRHAVGGRNWRCADPEEANVLRAGCARCCGQAAWPGDAGVAVHGWRVGAAAAGPGGTAAEAAELGSPLWRPPPPCCCCPQALPRPCMLPATRTSGITGAWRVAVGPRRQMAACTPSA